MTTLPTIQKENASLTEQRCPVCRKVLFETHPETTGTVKIQCRQCGKRRFVQIECEEKKVS
jgi:hypothetical protein